MPCFFIVKIYTQLVPCDYEYFLKIWENSIRQKLKKMRKTDGRRQDFHLFTAFYLLFLVFKKRWRATRTTFCRLSESVYSMIRADVINEITRSEITGNPGYFICHREKNATLCPGLVEKSLQNSLFENFKESLASCRKKIKANTRKTYLECKIYAKSLLILI